MATNAQPLLSVRHVTKKFPGVTALNNVDFSVMPGEVHALLGENGAGKSTLMKIVTGLYAPDEGEVSIRGVPVRTFTPATAASLGVATVFQELSLLPNLTVEENIFLGRERTGFSGTLDRAHRRREAQRYLEIVGADVDPGTPVGSLSAALQQLVEITKALAREPDIIIMDEPTDKLFAEQTERLFALLRDLKSQGKGIVYISHRLEEIPQIADRVTVLRDGQLIDTRSASDCSEETMVRLMVGREVKELFPRSVRTPGQEILRAEGLCVGQRLNNIDLSVRQGEVVGIAGLVGAGRSILVKTLFGLIKPTGGQIYVNGQPVMIRSPIDAMQLGLAFIPEDRRFQGLIGGMAIRENICLAGLRSWLLDFPDMNQRSHGYVQQLKVQTPSIFTQVGRLSGGNQQKVAIAKWLNTSPQLYIIDEPTQGIDVGAKAEIYRLIDNLTKTGAGVLMVSSDMMELLGISDRVLVVAKGQISAEFDHEGLTQEEILKAALAG